MAAGERIERISYRKEESGWWKGAVRNIIFHSNIKNYPFPQDSQDLEYSITLTATENLLNVFQSRALNVELHGQTYFGGFKNGKFSIFLYTLVFSALEMRAYLFF